MKESIKSNRLASLDILRGLDLWLLLMIGPVLHTFLGKGYGEGWDFIRFHAEHVSWEGFALWDIIMPLFMFMSGITIPFSMGKYRNGIRPGRDFYLKLMKRFLLLFFLGWIAQGNLLKLDFKLFHPFANTLQAIAVGYVGAALMFVHMKPKGQIALTSLFFLVYIAAFALSGMCLDPESNIAMSIDKAILGCHRDGVIWAEDGSWSFNPRYQYTWLLSSFNFIVTVMLGCFAGEIIRSKGDEPSTRKALTLAGTGAALVAAGLALSPFFPIIKKIWSSSMTLYSGGICFLLMAAVYYLIDVKGYWKRYRCFLYFGMNSITAYMIGNVIRFNSVTESLLHGFRNLTGDFYPVIISFGNVCILFLIMRYLYRKNIFLKV